MAESVIVINNKNQKTINRFLFFHFFQMKISEEQIINAMFLPIVLISMILMVNNKKIMGKYTNGKTSNTLGFAALVLMSAAAVILLYMLLTGK